jgi:hypothetical protein
MERIDSLKDVFAIENIAIFVAFLLYDLGFPVLSKAAVKVGSLPAPPRKMTDCLSNRIWFTQLVSALSTSLSSHRLKGVAHVSRAAFILAPVDVLLCGQIWSRQMITR